MTSNPIFLSCETPATSNGSLLFTLESFDAVTNIAITLSVTGVVSGDNEINIATNINEQFTVQLIPYAYNGLSVFSDDDFVATFRMGQTQHIASIWSQCGYRLALISNTTGAVIKVNPRPVLMTVADARSQATIKGFTFTGPDGSDFTDSQITDLLLKGSSQIVTFLKCNVAITTYFNTWRGQDNKSVFTKPCPGIERDPVVVRRKAYINLYTNPTYMTFTFYWNRLSGELNYRPSSVVVNTKSPFDLDNEIDLTFTAGYYTIPEEIKWALTDLNEMNLLGLYNVRSLKGGSGAIEFQNPGELYSRIFAPIKYMRS